MGGAGHPLVLSTCCRCWVSRCGPSARRPCPSIAPSVPGVLCGWRCRWSREVWLPVLPGWLPLETVSYHTPPGHAAGQVCHVEEGVSLKYIHVEKISGSR